MPSDSTEQELRRLKAQLGKLKREVSEQERRKGSLGARFPRRRGQTVQVIEAVVNARTFDKIQTRIDAKKEIISVIEGDIQELEKRRR